MHKIVNQKKNLILEISLESRDTDVPEDTSCNTLMRVRRILPVNNATAPVNTQPIVLTIGQGDGSHLEVRLLDSGGEEVETEQDVRCYIHGRFRIPLYISGQSCEWS